MVQSGEGGLCHHGDGYADILAFGNESRPRSFLQIPAILFLVFDPTVIVADLPQPALRKALHWTMRLSMYNYVCVHIRVLIIYGVIS